MSLKLVPFESSGKVSYLPFIVTYIISLTKQDIGRKSRFVIPSLVQLPNGENVKYNRFDKIPACDGQTDRQTNIQTDILRQHSPRYAQYCAVKTEYVFKGKAFFSVNIFVVYLLELLLHYVSCLISFVPFIPITFFLSRDAMQARPQPSVCTRQCVCHVLYTHNFIRHQRQQQ